MIKKHYSIVRGIFSLYFTLEWGIAQHPNSLLHRLPTTRMGQRPVLNDIQPSLHPLEVLFDIEKLMRVSSVRATACFRKQILSNLAESAIKCCVRKDSSGNWFV